MDRAEYKERMARIDGLLEEEKYEDALDLLDSINWRKVHNVNYLLEGADKYERMAKTYDAKELLEIAHERSPMGRMIIYRLALCCANLGEIENAKEYYQKFIELAPNDNLKFIIKYAINKVSEADDYTLISILEELRASELLEEWAFELALLYRKTGQIDKCVSVLDDIILWFGDGPIVEKSFEMKLLYRPLTKDQEIKYQRLITSGSSVVEIHPGDRVAKDEFLGRTIRIPEIEESREKFNTQNLQAEIRKNIEEIMKASEMGEVNENIDAIRGLIEDIPHLQMEEIKESEEERKFNTKRLDEELKSKFKGYLSEEYGGQISLTDTGYEIKDEQIDGQMTIEEIMERWEKTRRAAEQALLDTKAKELLRYKEQALQRASDVLDKLIESEGGVPPKRVSLIGEQEETPSVSFADSSELEVCCANSAAQNGTPKGLPPKPRGGAEDEESPEEQGIGATSVTEDETALPPVGEVPAEQGIGATSAEDEETPDTEGSDIEEEKEALKEQKTFKIPKIDVDGEEEGVGLEIPVITVDKEEGATEEETEITMAQSPEETLRDINDMLQNEIDKLSEEMRPTRTEPKVSEPVETPQKALGNTTTNLPLIDISDLNEDMNFQVNLTQEEKQLLSYFASIPGMESPLVHLITNVREALSADGPLSKGHIVIHGRPGSGKTRLAQNIIRVLQEEIGKPAGNIGRIYGEKLNEKDIKTLFDKIRGGALIIEGAGKLTKDTLVSINLVMENDESGTLLILEDTRIKIDTLLRSDVRFAQKFTEKISIPVMTIDELVTFGKIYAAENGFGIDEMGVLALYDRVNLCGRPDQPASVNDVKEILDDAMAVQNNTRFKGIFGIFSNKSGDDSVPVLQEKDFRED